MTKTVVTVTVGEETLEFETGRIAKQAHGAVLCRSGDTMVLSTACMAPEANPSQDFFPLTVDYREKFYSVGQIPGNFFRREARPSEREILVSRLTDRPLRPLFPKGFFNEVQVCQTVLSADNIHDPDVISINAASAALHISPIPFAGPIGAVRVGRINGELVVNPRMDHMEQSELDLVIAGTYDAIMMVEGQAKEVPEPVMVDALEFGHQFIREIVKAIEELRRRAGVEKVPFTEPVIPEEVVQAVEQQAEQRIREALAISEKQQRYGALESIKQDVIAALKEKYGEEWMTQHGTAVAEAYSALKKRLLRDQVIQHHVRIDGRGLEDIRPISIEVGVLPRAHGSALFTRGETQALVTTTLGTSRDEQRLDELTGDEFRRFFLHYNFPPWSVGEVRRMTGPGRREIGHGKLAERALQHVLPFHKIEGPEAEKEAEEQEDFPYTIRIVSEITESNGSSSMATVCGGSLSLMDAGVPIREAVAGIAMGLIKEGDEIRILSDILGDEDHLGDMDFKVCGTRNGITAFQLDTKIKGIPREVMEKALDQARRGRLYILEQMNAVLAAPRPEISRYAPRIFTIHIDTDKIRDVIGPGGKIIREIQRITGAEVEIEDDGTVHVAAVNTDAAQAALDRIREITQDVEVGAIYKGTVTRILNFGAFVSMPGNKEGLVHISELAPYRVADVTDVVNVGDQVHVKVVEIDKLGRINLSKVQADREMGLIEEPIPVRRGGERPGGRPGGRGPERQPNDRRGGGGRPYNRH
jgi:polyribonucleotide nucleotidyltransferase